MAVHELFAYLCVADADAALAWYRAAAPSDLDAMGPVTAPTLV